MKKPLILLALLTVLASASFAVPQYITYQGMLRDSSSNLVTGTKSMTFKIYDAETSGTSKYSQGPSSVSVSNGAYTVQLGPITGTTVFDGSDRWLEVAVEGTTMTPRLKINSVAYAIRTDYATTAESATTATTANSVADNAISTAKLAATSVTAAKLGSDVAGSGLTGGNGSALAVDSGTTASKIVKLDSNAKLPAIDGSQLTNIAATSIADSAVTTAKIADSNVTTAKIADSNVTTAKLAGSITDDKLSTISTAGKVSGSAITSGTIGGTTAVNTSGNITTSGILTLNKLATTGTNMFAGTGTVPTGLGGATINNSAVTANSIILISVGSAGTPADAGTEEPLKVSDVTPPNFTVKTLDGNNSSGATIPFSYLIIN